MRLENYPKDSVPQESRLLTKIDGNASEFHLVALFHNPEIKIGEAITDLGSFIDKDIMGARERGQVIVFDIHE